MAEVQIGSALPKGWIPDGASVYVLAHRDADGRWESLIPEFTIAGMGDTLEGAALNAIELLDDYLMLCARDGRSFEESYRPAGWSLRLAVLREAFASLAAAWPLPRNQTKSHARYKVPLRLVGVH